ncbi:MAG: nitroreductase/quinone reductase family protein, partial [Myxococcota bacterium]
SPSPTPIQSLSTRLATKSQKPKTATRSTTHGEGRRFMSNWLMFTRLHRTVYQGTRGLIGHNLLGIQMLLLTTRGRKTGQRRTMPLAYIEDRGDFVVVASNGGAERSPAWWLNLQAATTAAVQVGAESFEVHWSEAPENERLAYWRKLQDAIPAYRTYRHRSEREIPIIRLSRSVRSFKKSPIHRSPALTQDEVLAT